jgi:hypothetical protein
MGKVRRKARHLAIKRDHLKRMKISVLKEKYESAESSQRQKIIQKILKLSPSYPVDELVKSRK